MAVAGGEVERGVAGVVFPQQIFREEKLGGDLVEVAVFGGEVERRVAGGVGPGQRVGAEWSGV